MWMMKMKKSASLILLVCFAASLLLPVACSKGSSSDWVGATPLEEALANGKPTVAEFGATTCIPCKAMKPVLEGIVAEYGDRINLSFIDVRYNSSLTTKYKISLIPTQVFFDSAGQEVTRHVGYWAKEDVLAHLQELGFI
jgi:thioredoxin 1